MKVKNTMPAPKHRNIQHLSAKMKSGSGAHPSERKPGPDVEDWEDEEDELTPLPSWRDPPMQFIDCLTDDKEDSVPLLGH